MRVERFHEEHDVELTPDEQNVRGRQAARLALAHANHERTAEAEADAWKERKKVLVTTGDLIVANMRAASRAAETGIEPRQVECREELRGVMVLVIRCDTEETVSTRAATKAELSKLDEPRAKPAPTTPQSREGGIRGHIAELCAKLRPETTLLKALAKACPDATPDELMAAVCREVELGTLTEDATGRLMWVAPPPGPETDDGVVPDDYQPNAAH